MRCRVGVSKAQRVSGRLRFGIGFHQLNTSCCQTVAVKSQRLAKARHGQTGSGQLWFNPFQRHLRKSLLFCIELRLCMLGRTGTW